MGQQWQQSGRFHRTGIRGGGLDQWLSVMDCGSGLRHSLVGILTRDGRSGLR